MASDKDLYIRELLRSYDDGTTTLEQETELKEFFLTSDDIPSDLQYAKGIFMFFSDSAAEVLPGITPAVRPAQEIMPGSKRSKAAGFGMKLLRRSLSIAALVAVIAAVTIGITGRVTQEPRVYGYVNGEPLTDLESARGYAGTILEFIQESFVKPRQQLETLSEYSGAFEALGYLSHLEKLALINEQ